MNKPDYSVVARRICTDLAVDNEFQEEFDDAVGLIAGELAKAYETGRADVGSTLKADRRKSYQEGQLAQAEADAKLCDQNGNTLCSSKIRKIAAQLVKA